MTINANSAAPAYYILTLYEVRAAAHRGVNAAGTVSYWLQLKAYARPEFHEAWDRLGSPTSVGSAVDLPEATDDDAADVQSLSPE